MSTHSYGDASSGGSGPRKRRVRYKGTHPRHFEEKYKERDPASFPALQEHVRGQGRTPAGTHIPVLMDELISALSPTPGDAVADCTLGYGGHAAQIIRRVDPGGRFVGLDVDGIELEKTRARLENLSRVESDSSSKSASPPNVKLSFHRSHFAGLGRILALEGLDGFNVIYADLGVSSMQIDDSARGFSYKHDGPLDMRMDDRLKHTAADVLARVSREELAAALSELADESQAEAIAERIIERRSRAAILRSSQLVDIVFEVKGLTRRTWRGRPPSRRGDLHPAARTFQALRMIVNDEASGLAQFLRIAPYCLRPGGRIAVISFHSGEDAQVAFAFQLGKELGALSYISEIPVGPTASEVASNPRSRSALLRWAMRE